MNGKSYSTGRFGGTPILGTPMFVHIDQGIRGPILIWQLKPGFWHAEGVLKARPSPSSSQGLSEIQGSAYSLEVYNCPIQMCVCVCQFQYFAYSIYNSNIL